MKHFIFSLSMAVGLMTGLTGCDDRNDVAPEQKPQEEVISEGDNKPTDFSPIILDSDQMMANEATQKFAYKFLQESMRYYEAQGYDGNMLLSPLGVSNVLTMLANGANESAAAEITSLLGCDLSKLNSLYETLSTKLAAADNQVEFSSSNSSWFDSSVTPSSQYTELLKDLFKADSFILDMNSEEARSAVNRWSAEKTHNMIPELFKGKLDNTMMLLMNVLYFNGKWTKPFDKNETTKGYFYSSGKVKNEVEMMRGSEKITYRRLNDGSELVSIPYGNQSFSLNICLPKKGSSIEEMLNANPECLSNAMSMQGCALSLPKFAFSFDNTYMREILQNMGIGHLFNSEGSLSKIAAGLSCDTFRQLTNFKIDEAGAEAASVTYAGVVGAQPDAASEPVEVVVDRPFVFSITEQSNNIVILSGIVRKL